MTLARNARRRRRRLNAAWSRKARLSPLGLRGAGGGDGDAPMPELSPKSDRERAKKWNLVWSQSWRLVAT